MIRMGLLIWIFFTFSDTAIFWCEQFSEASTCGGEHLPCCAAPFLMDPSRSIKIHQKGPFRGAHPCRACTLPERAPAGCARKTECVDVGVKLPVSKHFLTIWKQKKQHNACVHQQRSRCVHSCLCNLTPGVPLSSPLV